MKVEPKELVLESTMPHDLTPSPVPIEVAVPEVTTEPIAEEKPIFEALCATCEKLIQLPFHPDGSRPTFCKDCLKDYQRAVAKERMLMEAKAGKSDEKTQPVAQRNPKAGSARVYRGNEQPMKLGQMHHVAPKKFKSLRESNSVELAELRSLVQRIRPSGTQSE